MTALGCIDAGITCVIDNSHNSRSAAHSDAAIEALFDSGIRAVHASGPPQFGTWDNQWPADLARLQKKYFTSDDQLVTLRAFANPNRENWAFARSLGLKIHADGISSELIEAFAKENLLGPDFTFNHANSLTDAAWRLVRETGCNVDVCTRSDAQYGLGSGASAGVGGFQKALDFGVQPGFSVDNETSYSTDMFGEMRAAFFVQRALATNRRANKDPDAPAPVTVRQVLQCATVNGAKCAALLDKCGTIDAGQGGRHRHDPGRRDERVSVEQRRGHRRPGGRRAQRGHGHHRRRDSQAPRRIGRRQHAAVPAARRRVAQLSLREDELHARHPVLSRALRVTVARPRSSNHRLAPIIPPCRFSSTYCNACGHQFEFLKLPAATTVPSCPACQSPDLTRQLSGFALSTTDLTKTRVKAARKQQLESKDHKDEQVARAEEIDHHR